jgi:glyoxylase-like metal-dependent hydrolase (beta-lactamase superfamily II)
MTDLADAGIALRGLLPLTPQRLPFDESIEIRAFALERGAGDLLIYSSTGLANDAAALRRLDIEQWYLNHWHEAMFTAPLDAPLIVHERDRAATERRIHVRASFSRRHTLGSDLEVIPTPGHTRGATAYLWDNGEHRMLFTGDTVYLRDGEWVAAVLGSSDRAAYVESLELIRDLDFDVLVPWAASAGQPWYALTNEADRRRRIGAIIERVRRGEDA